MSWFSEILASVRKTDTDKSARTGLPEKSEVLSSISTSWRCPGRELFISALISSLSLGKRKTFLSQTGIPWELKTVNWLIPSIRKSVDISKVVFSFVMLSDLRNRKLFLEIPARYNVFSGISDWLILCDTLRLRSNRNMLSLKLQIQYVYVFFQG